MMASVEEQYLSRKYHRNMVLALLAIGLIAGAIWRFTSLHERIGLSTLVGWGESIQGHPWTPVVVLLIYILSGLLFFAHALILWATFLTFDLPHAMVFVFTGSLASSLSLFGLGHVLRRDVVRRLTGSRAEVISQAMAQKGIWTIALLHVFPVVPFSVLNLTAGATHIRFRDFVIGTVIGMTPGLILLLAFGWKIIEILKHPNIASAMGLAGFLIVGWFILARLRHKVLRDNNL
jgi:phospholipase D1/2